MTTFQNLGFSELLQRALVTEGYTTPTPIQAKAIPLLMEGHDLLGIAQTGTGKTAAFALPILNKLLLENRKATPGYCSALILAPTRELAAQITDSFRSYGRNTRFSVATVVGGLSYGPQIKALRAGVDILVATPGRLIDHLDSGNIRLSETAVVVLDEADHMLDLGFVVPIRKILAKLPHKRQSLFFSATMPKEIAKLAGEMLKNPKEVSVAPAATTTERVEQLVYLCDGGSKRGLLVELMENPDVKKAIVFTRTKRGADKVSKTLDDVGIASASIHGNKSQNQRQRALDDFKAGRTRVLVATDIAARGIDVDGITHVINFELPDVPEQYVHRIGRTARAGASGIAIAFCDNSERGLLRDIEKVTRQQIETIDKRGVKVRDVPQPVMKEHVDPRGQNGRGGERFGRGGGQGGRSGGGQGGNRGGRNNEGRSFGGPRGDNDRPQRSEGRSSEVRAPRPVDTDFVGERARPQAPKRDFAPRQESAPRQERPRQDRPRQDGAPRQDRPRAEPRFGGRGNRG